MKSKARTITTLGISIALAMILSYIEFLLPPLYAAVPGVKMGLANIAIVFVLYRLGAPKACAVSIVRLLLTSLLFGITMLPYSAAGAVLSLTVMIIMKRFNKFSTIGVSICGGVFHNVGQIIVAILITGTAELGYYMIILSVTGLVSGVLIGIASALLLKYIPDKLTGTTK